ncbi:hypothetical protein H5P35_18525 [Mycobacterium haemophilum DSM 44634]|nr:hypothetical protein [Mycobacterium haemophilum DSM 44634]
MARPPKSLCSRVRVHRKDNILETVFDAVYQLGVDRVAESFDRVDDGT